MYCLLIIANRKALLLGSGFVTKPTLQLLSDASVEVTVACRTLENAKKLCEGCKNTTAISLDVNDSDALDSEVAKVDGLWSMSILGIPIDQWTCSRDKPDTVYVSCDRNKERDKEEEECGHVCRHESPFFKSRLTVALGQAMFLPQCSSWIKVRLKVSQSSRSRPP